MASNPATPDNGPRNSTSSGETPYQAQSIDIGHTPTEPVVPPRATWHIAGEVQKMRERDDEGGEKLRKLGVTWQNPTIKGINRDSTFNENVLSQFNLFQKSSKGIPTKTIIHNAHGCIKPREMLLVLGRPGSGCMTLLNVLSNNRLGYEEIIGDIKFGNMSAEEAKNYYSQIVMNMEEEIFFPTLTVGDTIDFAAQ